MKKIIISYCVALVFMSCNTKNNSTMKTNEIFPKGQKATENFTGDTWVQILTVDGENFDAMSYNVTFAAGSRTDWHSHPGGQILYCTSGEGCYQEKGKPVLCVCIINKRATNEVAGVPLRGLIRARVI